MMSDHRSSSSDASAIPSPQDSQLSRIREGDITAFDAFYHEVVPSLLRFAQRIAPAHLAEDAIQDVMLELWERRQTLVVHGSLRGYVFGAVRLRLASWYRRERMASSNNERLKAIQHPAISGGIGSTSPAQEVEANELESAIRVALNGLSAQSRMILTLRWVDGLTYPEVASALGISLEAAKKQGRRMEGVLRNLLARFAPDAGED